MHRDLKPANLLLSNDRRSLLIADFGVAKYCDQSMRAGRTSDRQGTLQYMAPELLQSTEQFFGKCIDVWSLGVLLQELLTRERPRGILPWCVQPDAQVPYTLASI